LERLLAAQLAALWHWHCWVVPLRFWCAARGENNQMTRNRILYNHLHRRHRFIQPFLSQTNTTLAKSVRLFKNDWRSMPFAVYNEKLAIVHNDIEALNQTIVANNMF
jgi:hypothetical protein